MPNNIFEFKPPAPEPVKFSQCLGPVARFFYYLKHTYVHYSQKPQPPITEISDIFPTGTIAEDHVSLCKEVFDNTEARGDRLEDKANYLLAVIAFLMPVAL